MILFGTRTYVRILAFLTAMCSQCGRPTVHRLERRTLRLSVFFVPLVPIWIKHDTCCEYCGYTLRVKSDEAERLKQFATPHR